jgi:Lrp/AsnC family leucine-responsive transcriptional regulator
MKIDEKDAIILNELQKDGRRTVKELSAISTLSATAVFERIKKYERQGLIKNYAAVIDSSKLGKNLFAFAHISLKDHNKSKVEAFAKQVSQIPEVQECHYVTGDSDFILKILLSNMEAYREFMMEKLFDMENIAKVESYLSLTVLKNENRVQVKPTS